MKNDYLEDLKDWQEHQYVKGYYSGGRMPPYIKYDIRPGSGQRVLVIMSILGVVWITVLIVCLVLMIQKSPGNIGLYVGLGLLVCLTALLVYASYGTKAAKKKTRHGKHE